MTDNTYPSRTEIADLAIKIAELAAQKRATYELGYGKQTSPEQDQQYRESGTGTRIDGEGTRADYDALRSSYSWILTCFDESIGPDFDALENLAAIANNAKSALVAVLNANGETGSTVEKEAQSGLAYLEGKIMNWHGQLADTLNKEYIPTIKPAMFERTYSEVLWRVSASTPWALRGLSLG